MKKTEWFGEYEILSPEEWLKINAIENDVPKIEEEGLNDSLWTNNVLQYMVDYSAYVSRITLNRIEYLRDFQS